MSDESESAEIEHTCNNDAIHTIPLLDKSIEKECEMKHANSQLIRMDQIVGDMVG